MFFRAEVFRSKSCLVPQSSHVSLEHCQKLKSKQGTNYNPIKMYVRIAQGGEITQATLCLSVVCL